MKLADECAAEASVQESEDASDDAKDDRTVYRHARTRTVWPD